jgi:HK97 family phage major capsid protein
MPDIRSQEQLEELLNSPERFNDYVTSRSLEVLGDAVKTQMDEAMRDGAVNRLPMSEEAVEGKQFGGGWAGVEETKLPIARDAKAMDGQFKTFGEFLSAIAPGTVASRGVDNRLKVLGESQGDQGGFLVPDSFTARLLQLALENAVVRPRAFRLPMTSLNLSLPTIVDTTHATNVFGGVRGYWTPESGSYTSSEPSFGRVTLTAKKLTAYTSAANELLADAAISLEALLMRLLV